jgi:hypothetical protein
MGKHKKMIAGITSRWLTINPNMFKYFAQRGSFCEILYARTKSS